MNIRMILVGSGLAGWTVATLLDGAAKAGVLLAVAALVVLCMRRATAANRHLVWLCALTGALLVPFGFKILPTWRVLPSWMRWEEAPQLFYATGPVATGWSKLAETPAADAGASERHDSITPVKYVVPVAGKIPVSKPDIIRIRAKWLIGGWAVAGSILLMPLFASAVALRRRKSRAERLTSGSLVEALELVKSELGMRRKIVLLVGGPDAMPMVWGIFRSHLLLPQGAESWSSQRLRPILLHEVSHLRRNDPLALLLGHLALAVHWFNPLAWWAVRQLRIEQENACDDVVLTHGVRSSDYAMEMLAAANSFRASGLDRFAALTMARPAGMESRIAGILDASKNRRAITRGLVLCVTGIALLAAFPLAILHASEARGTGRGRILDRNGIVLAESPEDGVRSYPCHESAAHLLGYIAKDKESGKYVGLTGVEKISDRLLSDGRDVSLALDMGIQQAVENAMKDAGVANGAAVVLDCENGDVLASLSLPAYDPGVFIPELSQENFTALCKSSNFPMSNRVVTASTPGSVFKLVAALAACRTGQTNEVLECTGSEKIGNVELKCWIAKQHSDVHGWLDLHGGVIHSCNCYFMQLAEKLGIEKITESAGLLGLGQISGSGYSNENAGLFPGPPAEKKTFPKDKWTRHDTAMTTVGQGYSSATPLQLAVIAAAVANGEKVWVPRLILDGPPRYRTDLQEQGWKAAEIGKVRSALRDNVNVDGAVAQVARSAKVEIAGFSGTAQIRKRGQASSNAWFVSYAPAEDPKYAIAVMVEGGVSGAAVSGPIARQIFETICVDEWEK
ncbi:hypothetical protein JIN84_02490 [Luteolibacter yonseiensis]|uniref:Penicillin-binding protein 2 n=1 Tax=Luteolibacter yonseiensis TaxID=1144680 RepID=A0A934VAK1_9BACT|nr:penicillin-binding transpeptidase domain-containing protein [Luteolibacter yonseiensis]MBK1814464.1 hypothetical protein [Luteolibacter yonseiensis]